jgi:hypothetical protein
MKYFSTQSKHWTRLAAALFTRGPFGDKAPRNAQGFATSSVLSIIAASVCLGGCASTIDQAGLEQRTAQSIGRAPGQFAVTDRQEETGGRINYTVRTQDGAQYTCYLYGVTGFQKAMTFGQTPHSDAICAAMVASQASRGNAQAGGGTDSHSRAVAKDCNALLRAAGRCGK